MVSLLRVASFSMHDQQIIPENRQQETKNRHRGGQISNLLRVASFSMHDKSIDLQATSGTSKQHQ